MSEKKSTYPGYTDKRRESNVKYQKNSQDSALLRYPKSSGEMQKIDAHCEITGEPRMTFIKRAIRETIERDRAKMREGLKNAPKEETEE